METTIDHRTQPHSIVRNLKSTEPQRARSPKNLLDSHDEMDHYPSDNSISAPASWAASTCNTNPHQASPHTMLLHHDHQAMRTPLTPMWNLVKPPSPQTNDRDDDRNIITINLIPREQTTTKSKGGELSFQDLFLIPPTVMGIGDPHALGPTSMATFRHRQPRLVPRRMNEQEAFGTLHFRPIFIDDDNCRPLSSSNDASNDAPSPRTLKGSVLARVDSATGSQILSPSVSSRSLLMGPPRPAPHHTSRNETGLPLFQQMIGFTRYAVVSGTTAVDNSVPPSHYAVHPHTEAIPKFRLCRRRCRPAQNQATAPLRTYTSSFSHEYQDPSKADAILNTSQSGHWIYERTGVVEIAQRASTKVDFSTSGLPVTVLFPNL
jgi:hypothetical protein